MRRFAQRAAPAAALVLLLCAWANPTAGQMVLPPGCGPRGEVLARLGHGFGEAPALRGIDGDGNMMELLVNWRTGTWTVVITTPQGLACPRASGEALRQIATEWGEPA